ncbi:hypothetical protein [Aquimarina sediminis]|uniref:hypothetical protein n=1 Tax=Aquimarina sediminis TaxID=2070536 RepID=UPI000CA047AB|nr:hypothetical protein [Aquimarina sediminis]
MSFHHVHNKKFTNRCIESDFEDKIAELGLPDGGKAFLDDFANASKEVIDDIGNNPDLLSVWVKMEKAGVNPKLRRNPKVLKKSKNFDCN